MQYDRLKHEILDDPAQLGYAGKSHTEIAEMLNGPTRQQSTPIPMPDIYLFLGRHKLFSRMENVPSSSPVYDIVQAMRTVFASSMGALDIARPEVQEMLAALVKAQFLAPELVEELRTMAIAQVSRAQELGFEEVWVAHVAEALGETDADN